jgi:curved DNA-binding protein CbpA
MPDAYAVLGVALDAADDTIRLRYLELIRQFPPEHNAERFAAIRAAYEKVKDIDARVRYRLFEAGREDTIEAIIEEVACRTPRRRIGLKDLLAAERPPG